MGERHILAVQTLDITHHLGLGMIETEHLCLQIVHLADTILVDRPAVGKGSFVILVLRHAVGGRSKEFDQVVHIVHRNGLVQ